MANFMEKLAQRADLPPEAVADAARITLSGSGQVLIERHRGLLSYSDSEVEANCGSFRCRVRGDGLLLRAMTDEMLLITGTVFGVDLE